MAEPIIFVLDTFALLAYRQGESQGDRVREILPSGHQNVHRSLINNVGEALYITERRQGIQKAQELLALIHQLPVELLPVNEHTIFAAAQIKATYTISYADAFAVAAAQALGGAVITDDPEVETVALLVPVEWLKD